MALCWVTGGFSSHSGRSGQGFALMVVVAGGSLQGQHSGCVFPVTEEQPNSCVRDRPILGCSTQPQMSLLHRNPELLDIVEKYPEHDF